MSVLSKFSKGVPSSRGLSFSRSASLSCNKSCRQINGNCYALKPEKQYKNYGKKLIRHQKTKPYNLLKLADYELSKLKKITWFRFSISGSVPHKNQLSKTDWTKTVLVLRDLCSNLINRGTKIHFPVESIDKAISYRTALKGMPVVVRRTIQTRRNLNNFNDLCAFVSKDIPDSFKIAKMIRKKREKSVVVCPAIRGVSKFGKSKCGICTACANEKVDLIIYPKH